MATPIREACLDRDDRPNEVAAKVREAIGTCPYGNTCGAQLCFYPMHARIVCAKHPQHSWQAYGSHFGPIVFDVIDRAERVKKEAKLFGISVPVEAAVIGFDQPADPVPLGKTWSYIKGDWIDGTLFPSLPTSQERKQRHQDAGSVGSAGSTVMFKCTGECGDQRCNKIYMNEKSLKRHAKSYSCEQCGKSGRGTIARHMQEAHSEPRFVCSVCAAKFGRKDAYDAHYNTHTGSEEFVCETCGATFTNRKSLWDHNQRYHDSTIFKCNPCNKSFTTAKDLVAHQKAHPG